MELGKKVMGSGGGRWLPALTHHHHVLFQGAILTTMLATRNFSGERLTMADPSPETGPL